MIIPVDQSTMSTLIVARTVDLTTGDSLEKLQDCIVANIGKKGKLSKAMQNIMNDYIMYLSTKNNYAYKEFKRVIEQIAKENKYELTDNTKIKVLFEECAVEFTEQIVNEEGSKD